MAFKLISKTGTPAAAVTSPATAAPEAASPEASTAPSAPRFKRIANGDATRAVPTPRQIGEAAEWRKYYADKEQRSGVTGMLADANEWLGGGPEATFSPEYREFNSGPVAYVQGLGNWLSRQAGDEMGAAAVSAVTDRSYDDALEIMRRHDKQSAEKYPVAYGAGELTGAVADIAALGKAPLPKALPNNVAGRVIGGTLAGGASGAVSGFAGGEGGLENRLASSGKEAAIGAAFGPASGAVELAGRGIGAAGRRVADTVADGFDFYVNPQRLAERTFARAAAKDLKGYDKLAEEASRRGESALPVVNPRRDGLGVVDARDVPFVNSPPSVGDLGGRKAREQVAFTVASSPTRDAAETVLQHADSRVSQQSQRVNETVNSLFADSPHFMPGDKLDPAKVVERLKMAAQAQNKAAYEGAFSLPASKRLWDDELRRLTAADAMQESMLKAAKELSEDTASRQRGLGAAPLFRRGEDGFMDLVEPVVGDGLSLARRGDPNLKMAAPSLRYWDRVVKDLGDRVEKAKGANGKWTNEAERLSRLKQNLVSALDNRLGADRGAYRNAMNTAKRFFDAEDAHEAGLKFFGNQNAMSSARLKAAVDSMSPPERELFARGYAASFMHKVNSMPVGDDLQKLLNTPEARAKIQIALGPEKARAVDAMLVREGIQRALGETVRRVMGDNGAFLKTAARQAAAGYGVGAAYNQDPFAASNLAFAAGATPTSMLLRKMNSARREAFANAMAELVTAEDPKVVEKIYNRIMSDELFGKAAREAATYGLEQAPAWYVAGSPEALVPGDRQRPEGEQPFARGGGVRLARPLPPISVVGEGPDLEELLKRRRRKALAEGGPVNDPAFQEYPDELRNWRESEGHYAGGDGDGVVLVAPHPEDGTALDELEKHLASVGRAVRRGFKKMLMPERHEMLGDDIEAEQGYARGGLVEAGPENNAARDAYLGVEGSTGAQPDRTAYDHKGRHTQKLNMRGPTAVASANSRRSTVTMGDRDRLRPERMRATAPPVDPRQFWRDLQQAVADHAMQRGLTVPDGMFPVFDEPEAAMPVAVVQETVEVTAKPAKTTPPRAPLDPEIAANARKAKRRRKERLAPGETEDYLP